MGSSDRLARYVFLGSSVFLLLAMGLFLGEILYPYHRIKVVYADLLKQAGLKLPRFYQPSDLPFQEPTIQSKAGAMPGGTLVSKMGKDKRILVELYDSDGELFHQWDLDWFKTWNGGRKHIPDAYLPQSKPGTHIHGIVLLENGDLVFNYDYLGLVRINFQGEVIWTLDYQTHHSVHMDESGNFWVCGAIYHREKDPRFKNWEPPFFEDTVLVVSPEGQVIQEWSVPEILYQNGLGSLLYLGTTEDKHTMVSGDMLHLNDVEPFPKSLDEGFFDHEDVMISLRNINTVLVFSRNSGKVKAVVNGSFVRQHDPDFIDGNRISIFDNANLSRDDLGQRSRILIYDLAQEAMPGTVPAPSLRIPDEIYTSIMGKHHWLENGNLLVIEAGSGRAVEVDAGDEAVWEFFNTVQEGIVAELSDVQRVPVDLINHLKDMAAENKNE